jgi:hypothetical protein
MTKAIFAALLLGCNATLAASTPIRGGPRACTQALEAIDTCVAARVR